MVRKTWGALKQWVEALIDERIEHAFGRDASNEASRRWELERELEIRLLTPGDD